MVYKTKLLRSLSYWRVKALSGILTPILQIKELPNPEFWKNQQKHTRSAWTLGIKNSLNAKYIM